MNKFAYIALPLLLLSISACSTNKEDSISSVVDDSSISSESIDSSVVSESSSFVPVVSKRNPMKEPLINNQYYLNHIGDIYNTWKTYQGNGITIAVIDVGFKYDHPDFKYEDGTSKVSKKSAYFSTSGSKTTTQVGTQYLSNTISAHGYNNDHGTFCAGVAAAGINGKGVIGIAPLAELMLLRTDGQAPSINEAFKYAANEGAKVITISIGSYSDYEGDLNYDSSPKANLSSVFNDAVNYCRTKKVAVISAAGNGGPTEGNRPTEKTWPGGTTGVIGVGGLAANSSSSIWSGSSYNASSAASSQFCDVFAPSEGMYGCCEYNTSKYDGGWKGTSFASPIVAGMAALYFEKNPDARVEDFEEALYGSTVKLTSSTTPKTEQLGHGRVDVGKLLNTTLNEKITAKVKNSGDIYAYQWNSRTNQKQTWPGTYIGTGDSKTYTIELDATKYDSVIFNTGGDEPFQTIDLSISSFVYGNTYDADDVTNFSEKIVIGEYK